MAKKTDLGIYLTEEKTFYYLEAGNNHIGNTLDRVRKTLIQRGKIIPAVNTNYAKSNYEFMSVSDAEKRDIIMVPIYISKHVQKLFEDAKSETKGKFK